MISCERALMIPARGCDSAIELISGLGEDEEVSLCEPCSIALLCILDNMLFFHVIKYVLVSTSFLGMRLKTRGMRSIHVIPEIEHSLSL